MSKLSGFSKFALSLVLSSILCLSLIWLSLERIAFSKAVKTEIISMQKYLIDSGYDMSYERLSFDTLPLLNILTVKDLKIYRADGRGDFEWHIPELKISPSMFSMRELDFSFGHNQTVQKGHEKYSLDFFSLQLSAVFDSASGLSSLVAYGRDIALQGLWKVEEFKLAVQKNAPQTGNDITSSFESTLEAKNVDFDKSLNIPTSKRLNRLYVNGAIQGEIKREDSYNLSLLSWLSRGGMIELKKVVLNWDPLTMVGRGDLYFDENLNPNLHLATSSKGLLNVIDSFEEKGIFDSKGCFVIRVILNNKAFLLNEDDQYKTVTAPVDIRNGALLIEGVKVRGI